MRGAVEITVALGLLANAYCWGMEWFIAWYSGVEYANSTGPQIAWLAIGVGSSLAGALLLLFPQKRG